MKRTLLVLVVVAVIAVVVGGSLTWREHSKREGWLDKHACEHAWIGQPERPYGKVDSCRLLDTDVKLTGEIVGATEVLVHSDVGLVLLKIQYVGMDRGWNWEATAHEMSVAKSHGLTADERSSLASDIQQRGGVRVGDWYLKVTG